MRRAIVALGLTLLVAAALWRPVAVPQLVKFPTHVDVRTRYEGTFTLHVDAATNRPLARPLTLPLEIDRRVRTLPGGGAHTAVLEEAVTYRIAGTTQRERHHYVIDRRSMQHRDDGRAWAFSPANRVVQAGTYRVTLPLGLKTGGRYRIWENEPGRSFWMGPDPARTLVHRHGLALAGLQEVWRGAPVARYYRAELRKQGFALELTFPALAARLAARGVDVERALDALPPSEAPVVAAARDVRLPLRFFRDNDGHALVERRTGSIVELVYSAEAITATPDLTPLRELRDALGGAASSPDVAALRGALDEIERAAPTPVYSLRYEQTAASVAEAARRTRSDLRTLDLVERSIPAGLAGLSLLVLLVTVGVGLRRRRLRRSCARVRGTRRGGGAPSPATTGWRARAGTAAATAAGRRHTPAPPRHARSAGRHGR